MIVMRQGEAVKLGFRSDTPAAVNAITVYDANDNVRVLQPYERLVVDMISFNTLDPDDTSNLAYIVDSVTTPPGTVPAQPVVAAFSAATDIGLQGTVFPGEGYTLPIGATLWLVLVGDGWATSSTEVSGTGRIISGKSQGPQQGYKALLTAGGNVSGQ